MTRKISKNDNEDIKYEVLKYFSNKNYPCCNKCGYSDIRALCLDHVNGDGKLHRKNLKYGKGKNLYNVLYRNYFKCDYELQTLCFNCNTIKLFEKRENDHKKTKIWKENISKSLQSVTRPIGSRSSRARKVAQYTKEGKLIKIWDYIKEAENYYNNNKNAKNIVACCNNRQTTAYGFLWSHYK